MATRPAGDLIAEYHRLLKNEFMTDLSGQSVLTTRAVQEMIQQARSKAADEKAEIDRKIVSLKEEAEGIKKSMQAELDQERQYNQEAAEHDRKSIKWRIKIGRRGRVTRWSSPNYEEQRLAGQCRKQAAEHEAEATKYSREIRRLDAELAPLRSRSAWLAPMAVPTGRTLPAKEFWEDLTTDQREQLERVGINRDQLRKLIGRIGETEASFVASARELERGVASDDELVRSLREYFQGRLASLARKDEMARR